MKAKPLWQVSLLTASQVEEPAAALLERILGLYPAIYANAESGLSTLTVYWSRSLRRAEVDEIRSGLSTLGSLGLNIGPGTIRSNRVRREDWSHSWKKYFKNIEVGQSLLIRPSWSKRLARRGQALVVLDPGLSFGTGQHPTTSFCLGQLVAARLKSVQQSALDVGCGSGILSIAAVKLGYQPVRAFDFDPVAVRVAQANARRNRVHDRLVISRGDLTKISKQSRVRYDVVCANLIDDLLVEEAVKILNRLKPGGLLVLAGILKDQFPRVRQTYERLGLKLLNSRTEAEWSSGSFAYKGTTV